jgi:hypothetical protein
VSTSETTQGAADIGSDSSSLTIEPTSSSVTGDVDAVTAPLRGGVEKGPLLLGSSIVAARLDADALPTGEQLIGQIEDDTGAYALGEVPVGTYLIEAVGYHYDEVRGSLGVAPITMRAIVDVSVDGPPVFVNALTHLAHRRVMALMGDGSAAPDAIEQAQVELAVAIPLGPPNDPVVIGEHDGLSLLEGDSPGARFLLGVSAQLGTAAMHGAASSASIDATLQQLMNEIADDLAMDGTLDPGRTALLTDALLAIDAPTVEDHLAERMTALGLPSDVPSLGLVLDQDRDGLINDDDNCAVIANADQADTDRDSVGDPCDMYPFGPPEVVAQGLMPRSVVVTPEWIYLADASVEYASDRILRMPTEGGAFQTLAEGVNFSRRLVATDEHLFWNDAGELWRSNLDGSDAAVFDSFYGSSPIGADSTHLYQASYELVRRPLEGGPAEILGESLHAPEFLVVGDDAIAWTTFWTAESIAKTGEDHRILAMDMSAAVGVAIDTEAAYWIETDTCRVYRAGLAGGAPIVLWAGDAANPDDACGLHTEPALAGGWFYWGGGRTVMRVPTAGGAARIVAQDDEGVPVGSVDQVVVDDTHVWWINLAAGGTLVRTRIP